MLEEILTILYRPILQRINDLQLSLTQQIGVLMATVQEVVEQVTAAVDDAKTSLAGAIDRVSEDVAELQRQVAEGGQIDPAAFDGVLSGLADLKASAESVNPLPDFPPAEPTP